MKKSIFLAVILTMSVAIEIMAAPGDTLWTRTYGGGGDDYGQSVRQTDDGGFIIAGRTTSFGAGGWDVYLIKTDADGNTLWTRTYGNYYQERGRSVRQTLDGGYIIAGRTNSLGAGNRDAYLIKTDSDGNELWAKTYGGVNQDEAWFVEQTGDRGYIIAGQTASFGYGGFDCYLINTNSSGDTLGTRTYGGSENDYAQSLQETDDGGYIFGGYTRSFGSGSDDFYIVKINVFGDTLWTRTYGGINSEQAYRIQQTDDGGYIVVGSTSSFGAGGSDIWLMKIQGETVGVDDGQVENTPNGFSLSQNYPNPFNAATTFRFNLGSDANVSLDIYNILGQKVALPLTGFLHAGDHVVTWDAANFPSGIYFYKLTSGNMAVTRRMTILK